MFELFKMINLQYFYAFLAFSVAIANCYLAIELTKITKKMVDRSRVNRYSIVGAIIVGFLFWLNHVFVSLSIRVPFSTPNYVIYFMMSLVSVIVGSYVALNLPQKKMVTTFEFIGASFLVTISILIVDGVGYTLLFSDILDFKPVLMAITCILVMGISYSTLRFLLQMSREDQDDSKAKPWKYIGSTSAGVAIAGIPYIVMFSIFRLDVLMPDVTDHRFVYMIPFGLETAALLVLGLVPDIFGERKLLEQTTKLKESKEQYKSLFQDNPDAVFSVDLKGKFVSANKAAEVMSGYSFNQLRRISFTQLLTENSQREAIENFQQSLRGKSSNFPIQLTQKQGNVLDLKVTTIPIIVNEAIIGVYGIAKDVTASKKAEEQVYHLAYHDDLTNLPNRRLFEESLSEQLEQAKATGTPIAVMFLDFDRFKKMNDLFGHAFGDKIIQAFSERLQEFVPKDCAIARLGGDEFTILVPDARNVEHLESLATEVLTRFSEPLQIGNHEIVLTISIGIALYPRDGENVDMLMKHADIAMYQAKEDGTNDYQFYRKEMDKHTIEQFTLENDLRKAIERNELIVYYQPKINIVTNQVVGMEALIRWIHPERGFISPGQFIPLAEETGLIVPLEKFVLLEATSQNKKWQDEGLPLMKVSVNLSQRHFYQQNIVKTIFETLQQSQLDPQYLEVEITESMTMHNEEHTIQTLLGLKELGVEISMDDFGTGYSSLSYLHKLPIDRLKIDQSFIRNISLDSDSEAIVSMIISMAQHLKLHIIAEGVETYEQIEMLRRMDCHEVQGFYFSRPVPNDQFKELIVTDALMMQ